MKPIFVTCIFLLFAFTLKAQFLQTGTQTGYYYDIVPDTLLQVPGTGPNQLVVYKFDVDNNNSKDITAFVTTHGTAAAFSYAAGIGGMDSNIHFFIGRIDTTNSSGYTFITPVIKKYDYMDTIQAGPTTIQTAYFVSTGHVTFASYNVHDWRGTVEKYAGFTYFNGVSADLGWVRVSVDSNDRVIVMDFDLNSSVVGIHKNVPVEFSVYPNPSSDKLVIKTNENINIIVIYNAMGKEVFLDERLKVSGSVEINVSEFDNGIYYLKLKGDTKEHGQTFLIQH